MNASFDASENSQGEPALDFSAEESGPQELSAEGTVDAAWTCEEIERLYRQALETVEAVTTDLNSATRVLSVEDAEESAAQAGEDRSANRAAHGTTEPFEGESEAGAFADAAGPTIVSGAANETGRVTPLQVIEALLFVGGQPLTAKMICAALHGEFDSGFVEQAIEKINERYAGQHRPYEIRLGEGGYRMMLRPEFEPLRNRVYGFGPKQVRLSQEALEILSLVAYRQPIARRTIEEIGKRNAGPHLRQLLQRELLVLDRGEGTPEKEVQYRTSPRFLQIFGLARLDELPQIEDLNFK